MLKKSRTDLASASITADNDSKVCAMNKNNRIELKCAIMTSERYVSEMHKYSGIELGCPKMQCIKTEQENTNLQKMMVENWPKG